MDFLTNKSLADRLNKNMNIAQSEIHQSYYVYTVAIDLEKIGIDENDKIELDNKEKSRRVQKLLDTISLLYRDIRGRRENLSPLFAIGGVYSMKNPIFENLVDVKDNKITVKRIQGGIFDIMKDDTYCGLIEEKFDNDSEIKEGLNAISMPELDRKSVV